jgi:ABC-type transport system involved in cytochrome bd biosynthesis fused ATPase/permease subunit
MQIEYEISEQDFLNAQKLAIRKSPSRAVRLIATVMPWFGAVLLIFVVTAGLSEGLSWAFLPGLLMPIFMLSIPVLNRRTQKKMYARATAMHGRLVLEADDTGVAFTGASFSSRTAWKNFANFVEDDKSFLLYQNSQIFNIVPKRSLSQGQIQELREIFARNTAGKS